MNLCTNFNIKILIDNDYPLQPLPFLTLNVAFLKCDPTAGVSCSSLTLENDSKQQIMNVCNLKVVQNKLYH